ncbi:hypothetical protein CGRA01v4_00825 [Colletotrichum graminicola]|nr:hypothetical protein CGRA01v4_00825 [Colletotrichum graminicola]
MLHVGSRAEQDRIGQVSAGPVETRQKTDLRQRRRCCPRLGSANDLRPPHTHAHETQGEKGKNRGIEESRGVLSLPIRQGAGRRSLHLGLIQTDSEPTWGRGVQDNKCLVFWRGTANCLADDSLTPASLPTSRRPTTLFSGPPPWHN